MKRNLLIISLSFFITNSNSTKIDLFNFKRFGLISKIIGKRINKSRTVNYNWGIEKFEMGEIVIIKNKNGHYQYGAFLTNKNGLNFIQTGKKTFKIIDSKDIGSEFNS